MALRIQDIRLLNEGVEQSVAIEFSTGEVRTMTALQLYEASRAMGQGATEGKTASQRRAEEILAMRRGRR